VNNITSLYTIYTHVDRLYSPTITTIIKKDYIDHYKKSTYSAYLNSEQRDITRLVTDSNSRMSANWR